MLGYVPPVARKPVSWTAAGALVGQEGSSRVPDWLLTVNGSHQRPARRGLILDLDDTLYPRERFVRSGFAAVAQHVSAKHGIDAGAAYALMTRTLAAGGAGREMQALCERFALPPAIVPGLVDVFRMHTPSLFLSREVAETLRDLRADGWALAILTNGLPSVQFRKVAALGLTEFVDEVVYADEHAPGGKPSAAPFEAALRGLDLAAAQCVCVGDDAARDVRGARALGIPTIRMARPGVTVAPADEADTVISSMRQLPAAAGLLMSMVTADVA
jgi:putative hydrolase of the HAD superfamily